MKPAGNRPDAPRPGDPPDRDQRLAELLEALAEQARGGSPADVDAVASAHPDLRDELRQLWAMAQIADEVASGVRQFASESSHGSSSQNLTGGPGVAAVSRSTGTGSPRAGEFPAATLASPALGSPRDSDASDPNGGGNSPPLPRRFGTYVLEEELGRGGMGIVYLARHEMLGRKVALKKMLRQEAASPTDLARFRAEAEAVGRLDHPAIVPVYEVGEVDGEPYFTMKLIAGETLSQRLAAGPLPPREAARILADVADAIHYAHSQGVLHRDLKPSNILLDRHGQPHVSDFGLAKRVEGGESLTRSGAILGTPCYIAPEQAAGGRGDIGPGADVYSLGAILYQTLTGRPPFQAASPVDTVLLVLEQDPLPPGLLNPRADPDLEMIALRCLQKLPSLRYSNAQLLAADLHAYLAHEPISARTGAFRHVIARFFRETHHATILLNWGKLWMLHSAALMGVCLVTNAMQLAGVEGIIPYLALWMLGLGAWASIFWALRRRAGPVTFVERQIAHVWAGSLIAISTLIVVERLLGRDPLELAPMLAIISGCVFLSKAGILSGRFYVQAAVLFLTAPVMALLPKYSVSLFGLISGLCFFLPGLKYYRQRLREERFED